MWPEERKGINNAFVYLLQKDLDDKFIEEYVKACKNEKFGLFSKDYNKRTIDNLEGLGILDKVKEKYGKVKSHNIKKDNSKKASSKKIKDLLASLTEKEKEELLRELTK